MAEPRGPIRVLYVDAGFGLAGGQYSLAEILRCLERSRVSPIVSSPRGSGIEEFCRESGVKWFPLPFATPQIRPDGTAHISRAAGLLGSLRGVGYLMRLTASEGVEIIHANSFRAAVVACAAGLLSKTPVVFHNRTVYSHYPVGEFAALVSRRIVAISKTTAMPYEGRHGEKLRIVPIGIDVDRFSPKGRATEGALIGYLGRISPEKGLVHLVRSTTRILRRVPDARIVVGGRPFTADGVRYMEHVKREAAGLELAGKIDWVGQVEDAPSFLERAAVIAVPSREEGLGRTMLEAMSMGKPVVAFDSGGPAETITQGVDGVLVPPGDDEALGDAIAGLLSDPSRARVMGENARNLVIDRYSSTASAGALVEIYEEIATDG